MVNYEFIKLQNKSGLKNQDIALLVDANVKTIERYRKGESKVPKNVIDTIKQYVSIFKK
jgi:hypothetical protein